MDRHEPKNHAPTRSKPILHLPQEVVAQIKSSTAIVSLTGVVLELLKNALDAEATKVEATVDFARGGCLVEDNGSGIAPSEFCEHGGLGKLYCTSKFTSTQHAYLTHKGTFLASLGAVSLLTIVSRHHDHRSHNLLALHHAEVVDRKLPAPAQHEISGKHGTRVIVRNLFGNLPVRVKQRAIATEQKQKHNLLWEGLRRDITGLALSWNKPISIKIRDGDGNASISFTGPNYTGDQTGAHSSELHSMLSVLTQANYILRDEWSSWVPVSASTSSISIKGAISLDPSPNKRAQFLSFGSSPLLPDYGHNELYDEINRVFALSNFGMVEAPTLDDDEKMRRLSDGRFKQDGFTNMQLRARKGVDRFPKFHLRLSFIHENQRSQVVTMSSEDNAQLGAVLQVVNAMVVEWLAAHHFRPHKSSRKRPLPAPSSPPTNASDPKAIPLTSSKRSSYANQLRLLSPSDAPESDEASNLKKKRPRTCTVPKTTNNEHKLAFSKWSRIKSGSPRSAGSMGGTAYCDFGQVEHTCQNEEGGDEVISWTDPKTHQTHLLNARTGGLLPHRSIRPQVVPLPNYCENKQKVSNRPLRLLPITATSNNTTESWLDGVLSSWDNPVFRPGEASIRHGSFPETHDQSLSHSCGSNIDRLDSHGVFRGSPSVGTSKLSRHGLQNADVVAQLDKKFILVKMTAGKHLSKGECENDSVLVLIDQHAADERIRVEDLFAKLCGPLASGTHNFQSKLGHQARVAFVALEKPIQFALTAQEQQHFVQYAARFADWGILFDIVLPKSAGSKAQSILSVTTLPPAISERCKVDPQLLITLLRSAIWKYVESANSPSLDVIPGFYEDAAAWVRRLSTCPEGLVDIVNSRACRSAIMFNDELSLEQCRQLVRSLCQCVFPFMCAHGRPSMVPLINIGTLAEQKSASALGMDSMEQSSSDIGYISAWKRWQAR